MKRTYLNAALACLALILASCSGDSDSKSGTTPPVTPVEVDVLTKENATTFMVDENATAETVALFYNLKKMSKTKFAIGQQDAFNSFYNDVFGDSDIKKTTGHDPALLGSDFMFITDKNNNGEAGNWFHQQQIIITNDVKQAYGKGMINIFSWHLREPYNEEVFYTADMTAEQKANAFKSILPGGENHQWYQSKLDKVAEVIGNLKDSNGKLIPVIFRPFHEFDGSWFWWGADYCSPDEYKTVFRFTVDYLKNTKGIHNILYSFAPDNSYTTSANFLSRYPGDAYVDVIGMDNYGDFDNQGQAGADRANAKLRIVSDLARTKVKIAALTETGYRVTASKPAVPGWFSNHLYNALTANDVEVAFVMFWNNDNGGYYVPVPSVSNASDFNSFVTKPGATLVNTLPNMYQLPQ